MGRPLSLRRPQRRRVPTGLGAWASVLRRSLTSGATAILFALGPLGPGLAMATNPSPATPASATGAALSRQVYVDRVEHICAVASARINDVIDLVFPGAPYGHLPPADRDAWVVQRVAPIIRAEIAAARDVPAPEGDEATVGAVWDAKERALARVEQDPVLFRLFGHGTPDDPFATPAQLAAAYGLSVCALGSPDVD